MLAEEVLGQPMLWRWEAPWKLHELLGGSQGFCCSGAGISAWKGTASTRGEGARQERA